MSEAVSGAKCLISEWAALKHQGRAGLISEWAALKHRGRAGLISEWAALKHQGKAGLISEWAALKHQGKAGLNFAFTKTLTMLKIESFKRCLTNKLYICDSHTIVPLSISRWQKRGKRKRFSCFECELTKCAYLFASFFFFCFANTKEKWPWTDDATTKAWFKKQECCSAIVQN